MSDNSLTEYILSKFEMLDPEQLSAWVNIQQRSPSGHTLTGGAAGVVFWLAKCQIHLKKILYLFYPHISFQCQFPTTGHEFWARRSFKLQYKTLAIWKHAGLGLNLAWIRYFNYTEQDTVLKLCRICWKGTKKNMCLCLIDHFISMSSASSSVLLPTVL